MAIITPFMLAISSIIFVVSFAALLLDGKEDRKWLEQNLDFDFYH